MGRKLKVISYYETNWFPFWEEAFGRVLPSFLGDVIYHKIIPQFVSRTVPGCWGRQGVYDILPMKADIVYCGYLYDWGNFIMPKKRPEGFVYTFLIDYFKDLSQSFIRIVRPNLMGCLQVLPEDLIEYGAQYDCKVVSIPWFIIDKKFNAVKNITAMCSGNINPSGYPARVELYHYLQTIPDVLLSCSVYYNNYPLTLSEYYDRLSRTKYYISAGIRDKELPLKFIETCNYGACLISYKMRLEQYGFTDRKNYVYVENLKEIPQILKSDIWQSVGDAGQQLIQTEFTVEKTAKKIKQYYKESLR